ncbi:hypothetical protein H2199_009186 [Coniosporium tulheliwenetii]|uniref:Uncharacterized protein n=1 Tax=Coniosporium tulheliwenetii TaxID=3383036 RepID=A0ACC2YFE5_9PEZI|nr:hypothetical protein H2199_009186 [Cladosporium sp. JES 115]
MSSNIRRRDLLERLGIEQLSALEAAYDPVDWFLDGSQADHPFRTVMTVPGRKCPACLAKGDTVWVILGKCCPQCGTPVN